MKSSYVIIGIFIAVVATIIFGIVGFIMLIFGYVGPIKRNRYKVMTEKALEEKYPDHEFDVETELISGEYGYSFHINVTDENGIKFLANWPDSGMYDTYHEEWNKHYYGKKLVEYQNDLRDELFPQIPYVDTYEYSKDKSYYYTAGPFNEVFFESMDDAIEASKYNSFNTKVTFKGIDLDTADDEEIERFAGSMADSLMWLYDETGYCDIRINSYYYRKEDEYGAGFKDRDELVDSIIEQIYIERERKL